MDIVDLRFDEYMASRLARFDEPVLREMEAEGAERGFPIVGRNVGVTIEVLARSIGARRVMELGSGFGYSAYWFARAVGPGGEVHCTDGDQANVDAGRAYLERAGLGDRVTYHVGDALTALASLEGAFDIVFCDIDKPGYPDAWRAACDRNPGRRPLHLRQHAGLRPGHGPGRGRGGRPGDPRAQRPGRRRRAVHLDDRPHP